MNDLVKPLARLPLNRKQWDRWLRSWEVLGHVLYVFFGIITFGMGVVFIRSPRELLHYGFGFLGRDIFTIGPGLIILAILHILCTTAGFWPRLLVALLSITFYGGVSGHNASPSGAWIYGCVAFCHLLLFPPRRT